VSGYDGSPAQKGDNNTFGRKIMAGTFSQLHIQLVFAVQGRANLITDPWRERLYRYITGIVKERKQKLIVVNGMPDHLHAFIGLTPAMAISDLVREMKNKSTNFINKHRWVREHFEWQEGYGAFSYGHSQIDAVYRYIANQQLHHKKRTFREEYTTLLKNFEIEYDERYLFTWIE
jgi:putative transposase